MEYAIRDLLCLAYFTKHNVFEVHPHCVSVLHFCLLAESYSIVCVDHVLFLQLGCFYYLVLVNHAAMTQVHNYFFESLLSVLGIYPEVELSGHIVILFFFFFLFFLNCHIVFHRGRTILYSSQGCMRVLIFSYSCQDLLLSLKEIQPLLLGIK